MGMMQKFRVVFLSLDTGAMEYAIVLAKTSAEAVCAVGASGQNRILEVEEYA